MAARVPRARFLSLGLLFHITSFPLFILSPCQELLKWCQRPGFRPALTNVRVFISITLQQYLGW